ncbi:hypothetical protein [Vallitalea okinawensis]|uniref:hypothetical protein n=1 Tax=Vallitalea okinawensis TaxID=2078660 RepID=UPI000CFD91EE|nr:hypothetical protein [Vallitalea okinawensis]
MKYFQITAFILETMTFLSVEFFLIIYTLRMWLDRHWTRTHTSKLIINTLISLAFFLLCFIYFSMPYLKDLPFLISGDYKTAKGYVHTERLSKSLHEEVTMGRINVSFFIDSGAKKNETYILSYLPHSKRGINLVKSDGTPVKVDLFFIIVLLFFIVLYFMGVYVYFFIY